MKNWKDLLLLNARTKVREMEDLWRGLFPQRWKETAFCFQNNVTEKKDNCILSYGAHIDIANLSQWTVAERNGVLLQQKAMREQTQA